MQKEIMLDKLPQVLNKNNIDVKQFIQNALENLQCENYIPLSSDRIASDGYYCFDDQIKLHIQQKDLSKNLKE